MSRWPTTLGAPPAGDISPEVADARQFEERLTRAARDGAFLALLVNPKYYQRACDELLSRFPVTLVDLEEVFIAALREAAQKAGVNWDLVIKTDATPDQGDWSKLLLLVRRAMPQVEQALSSTETTALAIYPGLLARYGQMDLLQRLRDKVGRRNGVHGLWLLLPGDQQATINGQAVTIIGPGQKARIPDGWLQNVHRSNGGGGGKP
jgi:hypothetical protein